MAWLNETAETPTEPREEDKWLKIPDAPMGKTTEVKIRILDEVPEDAWRHWLDNRVFTCPGINECPVCKVRQQASKSDPDNYRKTYKMEHRYFFNVLAENRVKVYGFGNAVGRKLKMFVEKYGDLRDYDVSIMKRKTGPLPMNVEYDVIYEGKREMTKEESLVAENRYDLSLYKKPSSREDLLAVARGELPEPTERSEQAPVPATSPKATKTEIAKLKALIEPKNLFLEDFGLTEDSASKDVVTKLISEIGTKPETGSK